MCLTARLNYDIFNDDDYEEPEVGREFLSDLKSYEAVPGDNQLKESKTKAMTLIELLKHWTPSSARSSPGCFGATIG